MHDNVWTGLFIAFILFLLMFLTFYHVGDISDRMYEGLTTQKNNVPPQ
jgi:Fe2+ transport system protein B